MTDALRASTGNFVRRTTAPGRDRPGVGIVWLDRVSLVAGPGGYWGSARSTVIDQADWGEHGTDDTVRTTVEVPPGYLVVDVRVGYATAAGAFVGELRVADLQGDRKSALVVLDRGNAHEGGDDVANRFTDAGAAPTGQRTFISIAASVADSADHVAVRGLRLQLYRG